MPVAEGAGIGSSIGGLIGGIAVLAGAGGKGGDKYYREALRVLQKLEDPNFDFRDLTAPELQVVSEYFPEVYEAVIPDEVKLIQDSPELRASQLQSLRDLERVRAEGLPITERLAAVDAQRRLASEATRSQQAVLRDLAERGQYGGSQELTARLIAGQQSSNLAGQFGNELARERVLNRLSAIGDIANLSGGIRSQDIGVQQSNANYMNRFNELVAQMRTQAASDAAGARERAQFGNVENRQRIAEQNQLLRYETQLENLNRQNRLRSELSDFQLRKAQSLSGAYRAYGLEKDAEKAAREAAIMGIGRGAGKIGGAALGGIF